MAAPNQDVGPFTPQRDEPVAGTQVDIDMTHMASCRQIFPVRVDPDNHSSEVLCCDCGVRMTARCVLMTMASGLPIDAQREHRWPTTPSDVIPNVKREYAREAKPEDESDYEDPYKW